MKGHAMRTDPVTLQIFANHAQAAADSMAFTLFRTAHSTFVKETEDFTTGLATPDGMTFASPRDLGATWFIGLDYANAVRMVGNYQPGDICITNDPYSGFVCTHTPDLHMWKPIFWQDELVAFAVSHIHNTDVGGAVPASLSRQLTEVHQEGIRIPPHKLYDQGKLNQALLDVMLTNVRMPEQNYGDLQAQIAAMNTGERKVHDMVRKFGVEVFRQGVKDLLDLGERQARAVLRRIPDGDYFFADYLDEDAPGGVPVRLALTLKIRGDEAILDFSGSDSQLQSSLNVPTGGAERHILLMVGYTYCLYSIDPTILLNGGITRPARCIAAFSNSVTRPPLSRYMTRKPLSSVIRYAMVPSLRTRRSCVPRWRIVACSATCSGVGGGVVALSAASKAPTTAAGGSPCSPRIGSTLKAPSCSTSPPRPVTVRTCLASIACVASFSVVTGAPTTVAPVRAPTEAASDMWS